MFISAPLDNVSTRTWSRPDRGVVDALTGIPASIVGDVLARMTGLDGGMRLQAGPGSLLGTALTVDVPAGDNLGIHRALDEARPGDVLVVNGRSDLTRALIGDLIGEIMVTTGVVGAVIDGAIRDVDELSEQGLSVYARAVTPTGPFKNGPATIGGSVAVGGVVIRAGDVIVGDRDGVVVVPLDQAATVLEGVGPAMRNEDELRGRIVAERP